jgi:signal transduction histidine kinase
LQFFVSSDKGLARYDTKEIRVEEFLKRRVEFFEPLFKAHNKRINLEIKNTLLIKISEIELERLIDNNLSNALKYAEKNSTIRVVVDKDRLLFITKSIKIFNKKRVFENYYREDKLKGGFGIGLFIVKNIAKKYKIDIELKSDNEQTIFIYKYGGG